MSAAREVKARSARRRANETRPTRAFQPPGQLKEAARIVAALAVALAACGSETKRDTALSPSVPTVSQAQSPTPERRGGYYKDDGPGEHPPDNLETLPDAVPHLEPLSRFANRPYSVFGRDYVGANVNIAARLVQAARPGEVLVSDRALRALDAETIARSEERAFSAKGAPDDLLAHAMRPAR